MAQESKLMKNIERKSFISKRAEKELTSLNKVVIRKLPPSITQETFLDQVSPLPEYDFFHFVKADLSFGANAFCRAYISFVNQDDVFLFRDKFDNYVFVDVKGNEYAAIVEFAPFQKVPKRKVKKPDNRKGTIEDDPEYKKFLEALNNPEAEPIQSLDTYLEELEAKERDSKGNSGLTTTPLIEYVQKKKEEKKIAILKLREERKKRDIERRKQKEDERRRKRDKDRDRRDSDRDSKERDLGDVRKDRSRNKEPDIPMKLLKNPDREKETKETEGRKTDSKDEKPREKLRFAKENRPSGRSMDNSTPERKGFKGNDDRHYRDRPQSNRFGRDREHDRDRAEGFNKHRGPGHDRSDRGGGHGHDRSDRGGGPGNDRSDRGGGHGHDRSDRGRGPGNNRSDRGGGHGHDRSDRGGDFNRERQLQDKSNRDSDKNSPEASSGHSDRQSSDKFNKERDRYKNARDIERDKRREREREKMKEKAQARMEEDGGRGDFGRGKAIDKNDRLSSAPRRDPNPKSKVDSGERGNKANYEASASKGDEQYKQNNRHDEDDKSKRKRKERPERQIYVPRKALERRQQQDTKPKDDNSES